MIYVKSVLAGVAAVAILILAVVLAWLFGGYFVVATGKQIVAACLVAIVLGIFIFLAGYRWEFRRLARSSSPLTQR
jgi:hypothetical protein